MDYIVAKNLSNFVLVGHSFGGTVISKVAEAIPERIKRLVFLNGFVLRDGHSLNDETPPHYQVLFDKFAAESSDNTVMIPFSIWREAFINDADIEVAKWTHSQLSPEPYQPLKDKLDFKKFYSLTTQKSNNNCTENTAFRTANGAGIRACRAAWDSTASSNARQSRSDLYESKRLGRKNHRGRARLNICMMKLDAKPNPLEVDFKKSAIVVVDVQNAFASKGGMLDIARVDITDAPRVIRTIRSVLETARQNAVVAVYLRMAYKPDLSDSGGPNSPNFHKELAMTLMCSRPELKGKVLTEGTWDAEIVDELAPQPGDLVITKTRYSGFAGTPLDSQLRMRGIQYLFFAGIATNVCVESTLRDAYFHDYWPILLRDAAMPAGPPAAHDATVFNVESFFGWTMSTQEFASQLRQKTETSVLPESKAAIP